MPQETGYPDPAQLRAFTDDPMPFHDLKPQDFEMLPNGRLRAGVGNVEYEYRQSSVLLEVDGDGYVPVSEVDHGLFKASPFDHARAWKIHGNCVVEEDYVSVKGINSGMTTEPVGFDAVWILDSIEIQNSGDAV